MAKSNTKKVLIIVFLIGCVCARKFIVNEKEDHKKEAIKKEKELEKRRQDSLNYIDMENYQVFKKDYEDFRNGKKQCRGTFIKDKREGKWECYFPTGRLESEGNYKDNLKEGEWLYYYDSNFSSSPEIIKKVTYKKGKKNGKFTFINELGKVNEIYYFKNDKMDSLYTAYHNNGAIKTLGNLKNGKRIGEWQFFSEANEIIKSEVYN